MSKRAGRLFTSFTVFITALVPTSVIFLLMGTDDGSILAHSVLGIVKLDITLAAVAIVAVAIVVWLPWLTMLFILIDRDRQFRQKTVSE